MGDKYKREKERRGKHKLGERDKQKIETNMI